MADLVGRSIGHYHIVEKIGLGGMALVYKAYDTLLEREVAFKVIRKDAFPASAAERIFQRFEREAKSQAKLSHPNINKVFDYGKYRGSPFLVMEYLPGGTLKERLGKPISYREAALLLIPIANALAYAHERGLVHRDVKPANILFTAEGQPVLTDFGIAKLLESESGNTLTATGVGIGTPEYMASEQWLGNASPASDQYSLGIVFFEMVTGVKPYTADTPAAILLKQANDPLPRPRQFVSNLPENVEQILFKVLAKEPKNRYADMTQFANALIELSGETAGTIRIRIDPEKREAKNQALMVDGKTYDSFGEQEAQNNRLNVLLKNQPAYKWGAAFLGICGIFLIIYLNLPHTEPEVNKTPIHTITATLPTAKPTTTPTLEPTKIPKSGDTFISSRDDMTMIYVPAGEYLMGAADGDPNAAPQEQPRHKVKLDAFYIDRTEVTNDQFSMFVDETGYITYVEEDGLGNYLSINGDQWKSVGSNKMNWLRPRKAEFEVEGWGGHPVVQINWDDAKAYCEWTGRRLPTEAEWEIAAHGKQDIQYPWGNDLTSGDLANVADRNWAYEEATNRFDDGYSYTAPVGSYPDGASPYGVLDMSGNVWEWVMDFYDKDYYSGLRQTNPQGPESGSTHVLRGGSWWTGPWGARVTLRSTLPVGRDDIGFRCALSAEDR